MYIPSPGSFSLHEYADTTTRSGKCVTVIQSAAGRHTLNSASSFLGSWLTDKRRHARVQYFDASDIFKGCVLSITILILGILLSPYPYTPSPLSVRLPPPESMKRIMCCWSTGSAEAFCADPLGGRAVAPAQYRYGNEGRRRAGGGRPPCRVWQSAPAARHATGATNAARQTGPDRAGRLFGVWLHPSSPAAVRWCWLCAVLGCRSQLCQTYCRSNWKKKTLIA